MCLCPEPQSTPSVNVCRVGKEITLGGEDFLKEVVFEFSCPGWVCFTGKGRKVSKRADTSGGKVKSVFEGTVNSEAGSARRFQSRRKGQERPKGPCHTHTSTS